MTKNVNATEIQIYVFLLMVSNIVLLEVMLVFPAHK